MATTIVFIVLLICLPLTFILNREKAEVVYKLMVASVILIVTTSLVFNSLNDHFIFNLSREIKSKSTLNYHLETPYVRTTVYPEKFISLKKDYTTTKIFKHRYQREIKMYLAVADSLALLEYRKSHKTNQ